jgi:regulator of protease activity HflC (stomatin/prohibitin superfamily)
MRKTGKELPQNQIIATEPEQKGIILEPLPEGRYFRNPYTWDWTIHKISDIPAGKLGVKVRLFGKELPDEKIIARNEDDKGILPDILSPGKYRINPSAYDIVIFDAVQIRPGCVGIVTSLVGEDVLNARLAENKENTYLVSDGMKGVLSNVLDPGTYYLNPYIYNVIEVNLQSQRFKVSEENAISFLAQDGFPIKIEATIEFNIMRDKAAMLTHQVGDMEDIIDKVILPRMRGFSRTEGSKKTAVEFIAGETRQQFQNTLEEYLRKICAPLGVSINSTLIENVIPPDTIAKIIREKEIAVQDARKFEQQIEQAKSKAELTKQEMLAEQNKRKVQAETEKLKAEIAAKQEQEVRIISAKKELDIAKINLKTAEAKITAALLTAEADRDAIKRRNEAEAKVIADKVKAFGGGLNYARYLLYQKIAPGIKDVLTDDDAKSFGFPFPGDSENNGGK